MRTRAGSNSVRFDASRGRRAAKQARSGAAALCTVALAFSACGGHDAPTKVTGRTLTVYSSLPLRGALAPQSQAIVDGARMALAEAGGRIGNYRIDYFSLDNSVPPGEHSRSSFVRKNARRAAQDRTTIGYLGEDSSDATKASLPILARAKIAQVSPSNTYVGLTTDRPGSASDEPGKYYPGGQRTYARIVPNDVVQGAALAALAQRDGCRGMAIWSTNTTFSKGLATNLATAANDLGVSVGSPRAIDAKASNFRRLARGVSADCFAFTGEIHENAVQAIRDVGSAHPRIRLYAGNGLAVDDIADPHRGLPPDLAARFKTVTAAGNPADLPAAGKQFLTRYARAHGVSSPNAYAIYGYEAMSLLLDSIRRAGARANDRRAVSGALLGTRNRRSALGTYSIDANGDTTRASFGVLTVSSRGLRFERDVVVPASLLARRAR